MIAHAGFDLFRRGLRKDHGSKRRGVEASMTLPAIAILADHPHGLGWRLERNAFEFGNGLGVQRKVGDRS
ncbi:MAG: hypothetical protein WD871_09610 [Xanthobacteraceae bacterium]